MNKSMQEKINLSNRFFSLVKVRMDNDLMDIRIVHDHHEKVDQYEMLEEDDCLIRVEVKNVDVQLHEKSL